MNVNFTEKPVFNPSMPDPNNTIPEDYDSPRSGVPQSKIATLLESDMDRLRIIMLTSMRYAQKSFRLAMRAVTNRDVKLAQQVLAGDAEINNREIGIDAMVLRLLALHQPVARDLRYIVGTMRINGNVERMGDEAANIARRVNDFDKLNNFKIPEALRELTVFAQLLVQQAITAFSDLDANLAESLRDQSDDAVHLNIRLFREMLNENSRSPRHLERAVLISFLTHNIKRVCDQAENIAESVIFMKNGVNCKHSFI